MENLHRAIQNGVAILTINRPDQRNAMTLEMWRTLAEMATRLEQESSVRVVVLLGAGDEDTLMRKPDLIDLTPEEEMLPDAIYDSEDYAEGVRAFREKRSPVFQGK